MEINHAIIIPTGDEIQAGIVRDIDSPELIGQLLAVYPAAKVTRISPITDIESIIIAKIKENLDLHPDLIVLIGGSGGGHRFRKTLGKDFTHSALIKLLDIYSSHEIYGKNGHMWSKLIFGKKESTLLINVPGPFVEAKAAFSAFLNGIEAGYDAESLNHSMAEAVLALYPDQDSTIQ